MVSKQKLSAEIIEELVDHITHKAQEDVNNELKLLHERNSELEISLSESEKMLSYYKEVSKGCDLIEHLMESLKDKLSLQTNEDYKRNVIIQICELCLDPYFEVNNSDKRNAPLWIVLSTRFYNNLELVVSLLDFFNIDRPDNLLQFKLPCDWNEHELDLFFSNMRCHVNCNNSIYEGNLQFWANNACKPYKDTCNIYYDEVPWQFVLRNPLLRKSKYLKQIGENIFSSVDSNWDRFSELDMYQSISVSEMQTIINEINVDSPRFREAYFYGFIYRNISVLDIDDNKPVLDKFYDILTCSHMYDCLHKTILLDMPEKYLMKYLYESDWKDATNYLAVHQNEILECKGISFFKDILQNIAKNIVEPINKEKLRK